MNRWVRLLAAAAICGVTVAGGYAIDDAGSSEPEAVVGPGLVHVTIDIKYSKFDAALSELKVRPGTTVEFVVRNHDPINHEFMVGDDAMHRRHEKGTDIIHPPVPGEVSLGPGDTGVTFYEFDEVGEVRFACHLPGHVAYGMEGVVTVTDS